MIKKHLVYLSEYNIYLIIIIKHFIMMMKMTANELK